MIAIHSPSGEAVQLAGTPFAQGAEAKVYDVPQYPGSVVKLYHDEVLKKRGNDLRQKLEVMTNNPGLSSLKHQSGMSWPCFSVFDKQNQWRGYAMKKAKGVRMNVLAHAKAYRENFPNLDRVALVAYLLNLLESVHKLHVANVRLGDYNPANFLCVPMNDGVTLLDCDSWQVSAKGMTFNCPVAAPDMLPPELHGKQLSMIERTIESEHFSLAILLFKVLMLGRHPFDVVGGASPVENISRGYFPYGVGGGGIPKGPWFNIWSHMPFKLKEQFIRTFKDGCQNPAERTSTAEWIELLKRYQREMVERGWHETSITPATPKTKEYRGTQSLSQTFA